MDEDSFVTYGTPENIISFIEEVIVTVVMVWSDADEDYVPVAQIRSLDGALITMLDSREQVNADAVWALAADGMDRVGI